MLSEFYINISSQVVADICICMCKLESRMILIKMNVIYKFELYIYFVYIPVYLE